MEKDKYYLSSLDSITFSPTRECRLVKRLQFPTGKVCFVARVTPSVIGQQYGLGPNDLEYLVLTNRHEGETLDPIASFPCFVFIARPLVEDLFNRVEITPEDLEIIGWGELYRTEADATAHTFD